MRNERVGWINRKAIKSSIKGFQAPTQGPQVQSLGQGLDPCHISEFVCAATKDLICCSEDQRSHMPTGKTQCSQTKTVKNISHESLEQWLASSNFPLWYLKDSLGVWRKTTWAVIYMDEPGSSCSPLTKHGPQSRYISPLTLRMLALGSPRPPGQFHSWDTWLVVVHLVGPLIALYGLVSFASSISYSCGNFLLPFYTVDGSSNGPLSLSELLLWLVHTGWPTRHGS